MRVQSTWRRAAGCAGVAVAAAVLTLASALPASAAEVKKTVNGGSSCTTDLVRSGTSKAALHASGSTYVEIPKDGSYARVNASSVRVENDSCTSGNGVSTSSLKATMVIQVSTVHVDSCSVGFPSGVTCTASGSTVTLKQSKSCTSVSSCSKSFANEWYINPASSAGAITRVLAQVSYSGKQSGKSTVSGTTSSATWYPGT